MKIRLSSNSWTLREWKMWVRIKHLKSEKERLESENVALKEKVAYQREALIGL